MTNIIHKGLSLLVLIYLADCVRFYNYAVPIPLSPSGSISSSSRTLGTKGKARSSEARAIQFLVTNKQSSNQGSYHFGYDTGE
jgi:hypothetical protein